VEHQSTHRGRDSREAVSDTIVAAATPPGHGAVAIVRIAGSAVPVIAQALLGALPPPRQAMRAVFRSADGEGIDAGLALYFPAPHSFTGDAVLELQGHGGPVVVEMLIRRVLELGARRAAPGEFTQRAFLNGKLDLAQAEAVADLIDASSQAAARAALRSLEGEFSRRVLALSDTLAQLRVQVEAGIDFADEPLELLSDPALQQRLGQALSQLHALQSQSRQGRILTEGFHVVIAGPPNAGKSTLLNRLAGHDAAIVSAIPGTTRDILRERVMLRGMPLLLLDSAGLRDVADPIEAEGVRRARAAMLRADRVLFVIDASNDPLARSYAAERAALPPQVPVTLLFNKSDIASGLDVGHAAPERDAKAGPQRLAVSALTGEGIDGLADHLAQVAGFDPAAAGTLSARARHVEALQRVDQHLLAAAEQWQRRSAPELVAEELKSAQQALGEIVGAETSEELLGRIFASFCIGK
jgi:tRNA modification GTPase